MERGVRGGVDVSAKDRCLPVMHHAGPLTHPPVCLSLTIALQLARQKEQYSDLATITLR